MGEDPRSAAPGWYGKLPTLGDFASRRLGADFIEPWDAWLGAGLGAQRERMGDAWLEAYLASPAWRFVLMPGAIETLSPPRALAGVLMPSVDRVGRYFPLTLVADLEPLPSSVASIEALLAWLHRLEDVALDALQDDWSIDELEAALAASGSAALDAEPPFAQAAIARSLEGEGGFVAIESLSSRADLARALLGAVAPAASAACASVLAGRGFWLADQPERPQLLVSAGLPHGEAFARMFGADRAPASGADAAGLETLL
jgi:type VI secretion system protein ImpM